MHYVYCADTGRRSFARKMARALGIRCVSPDTPPNPRYHDICLLNWGVSQAPPWADNHHVTWLGNTPMQVSLSANKLNTFESLRRAMVPHLACTTSRDLARTWQIEGHVVYARTVLSGHSGAGIVVINPGQDVIPAPLYTRGYGTPFKEYRVHVAYGQVIDIVQKKRMSEEKMIEDGLEIPDERTRLQVRTWENGWVFAHENIKNHERIRELAVDGAFALGDMWIAAVDIAAKWRRDELQDAVVIEVNSAPALRSPTSFNAYVNAIRARMANE